MKKIVSSGLIAVVALFGVGAGVGLYNSAQAATTYTAAQVAVHNTQSDCWLIISGSVYNVTAFIPIHPGGNAIVPYCGADATVVFDQTHGTTGTAANELPTYLIGVLGTTPVNPALVAPVITSGSATQTSATINWSDATGGVLPISYTVLRNGVQVGTTAASVKTFTNTGLTPSTPYSYTVKVTDSATPTVQTATSAAFSVTTLAPITTPTSTPTSTPPTPTSTPPTPTSTAGPIVLITAPSASSTVSSTATVTATVTDTAAITRVLLIIDGRMRGIHTMSTASPYVFKWDTRTVRNGTHTIQVRALDASGKTGTSAKITVTVTNTRVHRTGGDDGSGTVHAPTSTPPTTTGGGENESGDE